MTSVLRHRFVKYFLRLSRIWSADLCQTNGFGLSFQAAIQAGRTAVRAGTEWCAERRSRLLGSSANHRSTRFIHDDEVGVKWNVNLGCLRSQSWIAGVLCVDELSSTTCTASPAGTESSMRSRNLRNSIARCRGRVWCTTWPVAKLSAANRSVTPCRL